jgi:hypothetical protein
MLYPVTPTLSVDAVHITLICEDDIAVAVSPTGTEGAVVSATLFAVTVTTALVVLFPAASFAIAVN